MIRCIAICAAVLTLLSLAGCKKAPPADTVCSVEPLPATAEVPSGQGGALVQAATDTYVYAVDAAGTQKGSRHVNDVLPLKPGDYRLKVNNSLHPVSVQAKTLTKCLAGGVLAKGPTAEYYYVVDDAGTQLTSAHLGAGLAFFPGSYQIRLNNSKAPAKVQAGAVTEIAAGAVRVAASTDEYYYVLDSAGNQIGSGHVGKPLGLFAGSYTLKVNNSESKAEVRAGEITSVPANTLVTEGSTDEYYYVLNSGGTQVASAHLGKPLALFPGTYTVKLNNSMAAANLASGAATIQSGSITVQGSTDEYYYVFDSAGTQLGSGHLGKPMSLMPGEYTVKLNNAAMPVRAEAGRANQYPAGTLTVKAAGSDYYQVLDQAGTQLASKKVGEPVSLPAGKYSVKVGTNTKPATVTAGQAAVVSW